MRKKKKAALAAYQLNQDAQLAFHKNQLIAGMSTMDLARLQAAAGDREEPNKHDIKWADARRRKAMRVVGLWLRV